MLCGKHGASDVGLDGLGKGVLVKLERLFTLEQLLVHGIHI